MDGTSKGWKTSRKKSHVQLVQSTKQKACCRTRMTIKTQTNFLEYLKDLALKRELIKKFKKGQLMEGEGTCVTELLRLAVQLYSLKKTI